MKTRLLTLTIFLAFLSFFMCNSILAQTVNFDDPGKPNMATSIKGLTVGGITYDVDFVTVIPVNLYGVFPGSFTFSNQTDADQAITELNLALNNSIAMEVGPVGGAGLSIYGVGYESFTAGSTQQCRLTRGKYDVTWGSAGQDQTFWNTDERLFASFSSSPVSIFENDQKTQSFGFKNYPNPFSDFTVFEYSMATSGNVSIKIFDSFGHHVTTLIDEQQDFGLHTVKWEGTSVLGSKLPDGVYYSELIINDHSVIKSLILINQ